MFTGLGQNNIKVFYGFVNFFKKLHLKKRDLNNILKLVYYCQNI